MEENIKTVVTIIEKLINARLSCMGFFIDCLAGLRQQNQ
jgi:hypothetical protein